MDGTVDQNTSPSSPEIELSTENNPSSIISILDIGDKGYSDPLSDKQLYNQDHTEKGMETIDLRTVENSKPTNSSTSNFEQENVLNHSIKSVTSTYTQTDDMDTKEEIENKPPNSVNSPKPSNAGDSSKKEETIVSPPLSNTNCPSLFNEMTNSKCSFVCRITPRAFVYRVEKRTPSLNRKGKLEETVTITEELFPIEIQESDINQSAPVTSEKVASNSESGPMSTGQSTYCANSSALDLTNRNEIGKTKTFVNSNTKASSNNNTPRKIDLPNETNNNYQATNSNGVSSETVNSLKAADFTMINDVAEASIVPSKNMCNASKMYKTSSKTFDNSIFEASSKDNSFAKKDIPKEANSELQTETSRGVLSKKRHMVESARQFPSHVINLNKRKKKLALTKKNPSNPTRKNYSTSRSSAASGQSRPSTSRESPNTNDTPEIRCETCNRTVLNKTMLEVHRIFHISLDVIPPSQQQSPTTQK